MAGEKKPAGTVLFVSTSQALPVSGLSWQKKLWAGV
jgi:hypothetical protein